MASRYDLREDDDGWTVFDLFTGQPVIIQGVPQAGLLTIDAAELIILLNDRAEKGDRQLLQ